MVILQDDIDIKNFQTTETPTINMIRFSKLTIAAMKNLNMNAMYSSFNVCFWLIFQGEFRNSTLLENLSNQLVQKSNKYYIRITFLVLLNVCVCVTILKMPPCKGSFDCHERIKAENDFTRFVIMYFIFTYKSKFFIKV